MYIPIENWEDLEKDGYSEDELDEILYLAIEDFDDDEEVG